MTQWGSSNPLLQRIVKTSCCCTDLHKIRACMSDPDHIVSEEVIAELTCIYCISCYSLYCSLYNPVPAGVEVTLSPPIQSVCKINSVNQGDWWVFIRPIKWKSVLHYL